MHPTLPGRQQYPVGLLRQCPVILRAHHRQTSKRRPHRWRQLPQEQLDEEERRIARAEQRQHVLHQLGRFAVPQAIEGQQALRSFGVGQLKYPEQVSFESVVLSSGRRVPQQRHYAAGGGGVQSCDHMEVSRIIARDSSKVKLRLDVLEPRVRVVLPKFRQFDSCCRNCGVWCKGLGSCRASRLLIATSL